MTAVLQGVRILEVAEHTFVPAASALMADWGAEVIKVEHVERGDAMRGLAATGATPFTGDVHPLLEHSNRGKRSLGLDLASDAGRKILYQLAASSDIFLTNKLPSVRTKLAIDVEDIRAHSPSIIYVRGSGQGARGPEADKGSYDFLAFWARAGMAGALSRSEYGHLVPPPSPGYGDSIGAMTIAGGMMGALYHRERTGEGTVVDVSLLAAGAWAMGQAISLALHLNMPWHLSAETMGSTNPLVNNYLTSDGRYVALCCLQAGKYWPPLCQVIERPDLVTDPRFSDHAALLAHSGEAAEALREVFAGRTLEDWRERLDDFEGQWAVVQNAIELPSDPQVVDNGYIRDCATANGTPFRLVAAPVQFDETPAAPTRAPEFNEHGDDILAELGLDQEAIIELKVQGVVA